MAVKHFIWGEEQGSGGGSGPSIPGSASYGPSEPFEGTLGAGVTTVNFSNFSKHVTIRNTHDTDSLEYSFDAGTTWFMALAYQVIQEPVSVNSVQLRNVGGGAATYEITVTLIA